MACYYAIIELGRGLQCTSFWLRDAQGGAVSTIRSPVFPVKQQSAHTGESPITGLWEWICLYPAVRLK